MFNLIFFSVIVTQHKLSQTEMRIFRENRQIIRKRMEDINVNILYHQHIIQTKIQRLEIEHRYDSDLKERFTFLQRNQ